MNCRKQRCTVVAALKAVELLEHEGACVHNVAHSRDEYNISSSSAYNHVRSIFLVQSNRDDGAPVDSHIF